jgi:hypothetical protein
MSVQAARRTEVDALIERLLACADADSRKQYIAANRAANWVDVVAHLTERVWQEVRVDTVEAQRIADITIETAEATGDKVSLAKACAPKPTRCMRSITTPRRFNCTSRPSHCSSR